VNQIAVEFEPEPSWYDFGIPSMVENFFPYLIKNEKSSENNPYPTAFTI
jgi:hypothetical protein